MRLSRLLTMFEQEPPPPCEEYSCPMKEQCARDKLACDAFGLYVETGRRFNPYVVAPVGRRHFTHLVQTKEPEPTHERYVQIMGSSRSSRAIPSNDPIVDGSVIEFGRAMGW